MFVNAFVVLCSSVIVVRPVFVWTCRGSGRFQNYTVRFASVKCGRFGSVSSSSSSSRNSRIVVSMLVSFSRSFLSSPRAQAASSGAGPPPFPPSPCRRRSRRGFRVCNLSLSLSLSPYIYIYIYIYTRIEILTHNIRMYTYIYIYTHTYTHVIYCFIVPYVKHAIVLLGPAAPADPRGRQRALAGSYIPGFETFKSIKSYIYIYIYACIHVYMYVSLSLSLSLYVPRSGTGIWNFQKS